MKQFEIFLVEEGLVTPADMVRALDRQRELGRPIGKIALEHRVLNVRQVFEILNEQATSTSRFGEIAVRKGHMTREQVDALLAIQRETRPRLEDLLVALAITTPAVLAQAQAKYAATFPTRED